MPTGDTSSSAWNHDHLCPLLTLSGPGSRRPLDQNLSKYDSVAGTRRQNRLRAFRDCPHNAQKNLGPD